jgi:hypothetical protein
VIDSILKKSTASPHPISIKNILYLLLGPCSMSGEQVF